jgi:hypothetical protein
MLARELRDPVGDEQTAREHLERRSRRMLRIEFAEQTTERRNATSSAWPRLR